MSEAGDILRRIVSLLDGAGIPHMIAGSFASTFHGTPRTTQDIDLVIDPSERSLAAFVASLRALARVAEPDFAMAVARCRAAEPLHCRPLGLEGALRSGRVRSAPQRRRGRAALRSGGLFILEA